MIEQLIVGSVLILLGFLVIPHLANRQLAIQLTKRGVRPAYRPRCHTAVKWLQVGQAVVHVMMAILVMYYFKVNQIDRLVLVAVVWFGLVWVFWYAQRVLLFWGGDAKMIQAVAKRLDRRS